MKFTTDEIEESQKGGAKDADDYASPYDLNDLSRNISDIHFLVFKYCTEPTQCQKNRDRLLGSLLGMLDDAIEQLVFYKEDLEQSKCIESFDVSSERDDSDDKDFWKFVDMLFEEIKHNEAYQELKGKVARFRSMLSEVESAMLNCDPIVFENYYHNSMQGYDDKEVVKSFGRKLHRRKPITIEKLRVMQAEAVIKALKTGIFEFADDPSKQDVNSVKSELNTDLVPCNFEITEDFEKVYAIFRQYTVKKGIMLLLDYEKYGMYIVDHKKKLTEDHFKAIFELDVMLYLIHKEMVRLDPDLAQYLNQADDTNTFGIMNSLTRLIQQDWFKDYRTDKRYDHAWIENFVSDLLASKHRQELLNIWQDPDKRLTLKGQVIGCLKMAGVINGSDLGIATALLNGSDRENKTFATYMGLGKKMCHQKEENYCSWIFDYVNR